MPYSVNEIIESDNITFLDNVKQKLTTINAPFIENVGQIKDDTVKYYANTFAGNIYVTNKDIIYLSNAQNNTSWITKEIFLDGDLIPTGHEKSDAVVNYFKGNSDNWKSEIPTYNTVTLGNVWPLIQVDLKAHGNNIEKIFTIFPGANISDIKTKFDGITKLDVDENGSLVIDTEKGKTVFSKPVAYQIIDGQKNNIPVSYTTDEMIYGFSVGKYNTNIPLVIDPLIASTFIGASGADDGTDIALDSSGNVYITGSTNDVAVDFPTTVGAYDTTQSGGTDVFVSKFNSNLTTLSASTFIGGSSSDTGYSIALDSSGNVYITGSTNDGITDYPTTIGAYNQTHSGIIDVFVSKFNSNLTTLSASTLIGGSGNDYGYGITVDSNSTIYITGETNAATNNFPTTVGAYNTTHNSAIGTPDVFVSKFNSDLTSLNASTFIGGNGGDAGEGISLDGSGNVYITGHTDSSTTLYPTTGGAYDTTQNGSTDVFVSKFNSNLTTLSASTFIGGGSVDWGYDITLDSTDNVYVTGYTDDHPTVFPITVGAYDTTHNGSYDVFVSKFNGNLTSLFASTLIGGSGFDYGYGITRDNSGNVYVTGRTADSATDFPTTVGAYNQTHSGSDDVFVSKFNSNLTTLSASTLIGGSGQDYGNSITRDSSGNIYVTGIATLATINLPTTVGAYDTTHNGSNDVFVSNLDCNLSSSNSTCTSQSLSESLGISDSVTTLTNVISTNVTAGISVTKTLPAAGTLEVTLPSTNKVSFTLPSGISGDVTVVTTNSGSSDASISFLGTVVDFTTASCTGGCTVAFNFTQAELTASGFSSSDIKIFHDSSGDGSFQTSEALTTTISTFSAGFTATASTPSTSKFAIGGVAGSVSANAAAGIGAAGHFLGFLKDNCDESGFGQGESLRVYEISYDKCDANQITILADTTCGPMKILVGKENNMNVAGMSSVQPYLNDEKRMIIINSPITSDVTEFSVVAKDNRDEFYEKISADQCSATKQYSFTTGYTSEQNNALPLSLPDWIKNNAKWWSSDEIDDQTFVNGIQYLIQHDVIFIQKNTTTENTDNTIPEWIKNNAKWWSSDEIDDQTFVNGIQYLVNNGVIKVD